MRLIHRSEISKPRRAGIRWDYWARVLLTTTLTGQQTLYESASSGLDGNIKTAGQLSTVYHHIITNFWLLVHSSVMADEDLIRFGVVCTFDVSGKKVMENILGTMLPADVGIEGAAATTATTTTLQGSGVRGVRFSLGDWIPFVMAGETVEALVNIPAALSGLSASTYVSLHASTRRVGYIGITA